MLSLTSCLPVPLHFLPRLLLRRPLRRPQGLRQPRNNCLYSFSETNDFLSTPQKITSLLKIAPVYAYCFFKLRLIEASLLSLK